jgi:hypothetical protein
MKALESLVILAMFCGAMLCVYLVFTSPEHTAQYAAYATAKTAIRQAEEHTKAVQAQEWGDTLRTWGMWGGGGLAAVGALAVIAWSVNHWQEQRTRRHEVTEDHTTQRHLITAKKDIALAYIAMCGDPGARQMRLGGVEGVYLPSSNELVPIDVCRAELALAPAQRRMITMEVGA